MLYNINEIFSAPNLKFQVCEEEKVNNFLSSGSRPEKD